MNKNWLRYIEKLSSYLNDNNLLEGLYYGNLYFDEPRSYYYSATIKNSPKYAKGNNVIPFDTLFSGGISFFSKELAMLKCLSEGVERVAQEAYNPKEIIYDTYYNLKGSALDPSTNVKDQKVKNELLGWKKGINLISNKRYLIPAQYIHYTYYGNNKETLLTQLISTGGATGWSHEQTLLEGLYEVIERDAFMTAYYLQAPVKSIDPYSLQNNEIKHIASQLERYNLKWYLFDMTNDLKIPVITSVIVDNSGYGPNITVGASCSFDLYKNLIKSVSEAIMTRPWIRAYFSAATKELFPNQKETTLIKSRVERAMYWYYKGSETKLSFWLDQKMSSFSMQSKIFTSKKEELSYVMELLNRQTYNYYFADISHPLMKKSGFRVYKVIAPQLHGLSLHEKKLFHNFERLDAVAQFYKIKQPTLNNIPHPFL